MDSSGIDSREIAVPLDLEHAGPYINSVAFTISDDLTRLRNQLQPVLDSWSGEAQTYYAGLQNEWNIAAEGLLGPEGVLGQIAQAMNVTWSNYTECEWANVQTWQHH
ncbi:WXG100 family type VII secretion target [Micromonospora pisi]|uniref:WXG100 family type VII secretion target n=1 Tax=Micromonospora pisi TaxID=589240 RepID=A0A495JK32_9ACTN|nr:WXG100 family type VII secretion target [Micromonospora pisi]RKR89420.1 WXG100 family type VII secretion target [Micromonospora pisi]